ncbi:Crossover junction endonuclease mus81 [Coemansia thaxteri]|uniref:Crossover junction endonuclease MUS81 n=1 Tax=Coemansia thaxteri TaxID=2663907 RepID=A0A9W8B8J9_9FUNG|nr:Crossover junction endonuclease mus81 [Coemansia thaxteri]
MSQGAGQGEQECANPLFLEWVNEWYDEACTRNARTQYTLKKAVASLQRYPLRMEDPQEALQLQGIGQGIVDRLAKRLAAWRQENGIPDPQPSQAVLGTEGSGDNSGERGTQSQRNLAPRIYVPRYRSGAFALLLGLFKTYCLYGPDYYIPKSELIPLSEQYADTPFHVGGSSRGGGGSRGGGALGSRGGGQGGSYGQHTAWSGIKTLESKSLVERQGGVKFCITEEGLEIAQKVVEVLRARKELPEDDAQVFDSFKHRSAGCNRRSSLSPELEGLSQPDFDDANLGIEICSSPGLASGEELEAERLPPMPRLAAAEGLRGGLRTHGGLSYGSSNSMLGRAHSSHSFVQASPSDGGHTTAIARHQSAGSNQRAASGSAFSRQSSATAAAEIELSDLVHYPKGEYDIMLIVDNREVHSVADRNLIAKELEEQGVKIEIRPLTVGDYLWIARAKPTSLLRHLPDIALDYVVERKRMDDLCASIRDGRYREQHSRIHGTGFTNVLYIVEGNDPDAVSRLGEAAVNSALSRVQVHHGFHLKRPGSFEATLKILRQTTSILRSTLSDVYAIPDRFIGQKDFSRLKQDIQARFPRISLAMTFDAYDMVSNKSGTLSVGEIYLRMLMTMRGVSACKALTIGQKFQTPRQLFEALEESENASKLIDDLVIDETRRKLGPALGKRVAEFWTADSFSTAN